MDIFNLVATIILMTGSGALAPGPLFFATISHGAQFGGKSGLVFSIAHTMVEFPLVILIALGLLTVANEPSIKFTIGVAGGIILLLFGATQIRDSIKSNFGETQVKIVTTRKLLLVGLAFTGLNPFFIIWWLTVGANLIILSLEFASLAGVVFMYLCHVWMDYIWLTSVAYFAKIGTNIIEFKWYRITMAIFGAILILFGFSFLINSLSIINH